MARPPFCALEAVDTVHAGHFMLVASDQHYFSVTNTILHVQAAIGARARYSTVTDLARLRGWSTLQPRASAAW
jgi:hypothetical protein